MQIAFKLRKITKKVNTVRCFMYFLRILLNKILTFVYQMYNF